MTLPNNTAGVPSLSGSEEVAVPSTDYKPKLDWNIYLVWGGTAIAIFLGAVANKIWATYTGPDGIGLIGIYRNLATLLTSGLGLGYSWILISNSSAIRNTGHRLRIGYSVYLLGGIQAATATILIFVAAPRISLLIFGNSVAQSFIPEIRVVTAMALVNAMLQLLRYSLNQKTYVARLAGLQAFTAFASLVATVPLLMLGDMGMAINVGSGSLVALILAAYWFSSTFAPPRSLRALRSAIHFLGANVRPASLSLVQSFSTLAALLGIQALIVRACGTAELGLLNAAFMIIETLGMILTAPVKGLFLPHLGALTDDASRREYLSDCGASLFVVACMGIAIVLGFSREIITLLFSRDFQFGVLGLRIASVALLGQAITWSIYTRMLFRADYTTPAVLELGHAGIYFTLAHFIQGHAVGGPGFAAIYSIASLLQAGIAFAIEWRTTVWQKGKIGVREWLVAPAGLVLITGVTLMAGRAYSMVVAVVSAVIMLRILARTRVVPIPYFS